MNAALAEVRAFLAAMAGAGASPSRVPPMLRSLACRASRGRHDPDDLLQDVLADLLVRSRKRQPGGIHELLRLNDAQLVGALSRRAIQVRATQQGSRSRLVKALRAHVKAALDGELPDVEGLPLTLVVADRICGLLVRQAVAYLLVQADAPPPEPRALAAHLLDLFLGVRPEDVRASAHGGADAADENAVLARADAAGHVRALRTRLGPDLTRVVGLRAQGKGLAEVAAGRMGVSTAHEKLGTATARIRKYAERHAIVREDLKPVLQALAA